MNYYNAAQKGLKNDMITLFILELLIAGITAYLGKVNLPSIAFATLLLFGYFSAKSGSKAAGKIGIVFGVLMMISILTGDIIDFILGLFLIIHSIKYNKYVVNANIEVQ